MQGIQLYQPHAEYMEYLTLHGKSYLTMEEFETRLAIYIQRNELIKTHNASDSSYKLGHNQFSDWTDYERSKLLGLKPGKIQMDPVYFDTQS